MDREGLPKLLLRGVDSLYVSFFLDTVGSALDWEELSYQKELGRQSRGVRFRELTLGTETFALKPYGRKPYAFVLVNRAFEVRLAENLRPSCHAQFFSEALWSAGVDGLISRFQDWCASMNFKGLRPEVIARADWAFDYHLKSIDFTQDDFVSRAIKDGTWRENRSFQSAQIGKGEVVVRVYDKVAEIAQQSEKSWFFEHWGQNEEVWRIEFQVRGERLRGAGIRTLRDLQAFQNDLLRELATNHTSLRQPSLDGNRSRWPLHPLWQALCADIEALPQTGLVREIDEAKPTAWLLYQLGKSFYGHLKRVAALTYLQSDGKQIPDLDWVLEELPELLAPHHNSHDWERDVSQRITANRLGQ